MAYHVMDTSALLAVQGCCDPSKFAELLGRMTELVEENVLGFPKAVVKELEVVGGGEPIMAWAVGLGKALKGFNASVDDKLAVMQVFQLDMGYDTGLEDMDGSDPAIVELAAMGYLMQEVHVEFWMVSEDRGSTPLRPTMQEICAHWGWNMLNINGGLKSMGLEDYLIQ